MKTWTVFLLCSLLTGVSSTCNVFDVLGCQEAMENFKEDMGVSVDAEIQLYSLTENQVQNYCSVGNTVTKCYKKLTGCADITKNAIVAFQASINFLCKKTLKDFLSYRECLSESVVAQGLQACVVKAKKQFMSLLQHAANRKGKVCRVASENYECIYGVAEPECGNEAAQWAIDYTNIKLKSSSGSIKCNSLKEWFYFLQ